MNLVEERRAEATHEHCWYANRGLNYNSTILRIQTRVESPIIQHLKKVRNC